MHEFMISLAQRLNGRIGFDLFPEELVARIVKTGRLDGPLDPHQIRKGIESAYAHLRTAHHGLSISTTIPEVLPTDRDQLCERTAKLLIAAAATEYRPEMPTAAQWKADTRLRKHLMCGYGYVLEVVVPFVIPQSVPAAVSSVSRAGIERLSVVGPIFDGRARSSVPPNVVTSLSDPAVLLKIAVALERILSQQGRVEFMHRVLALLETEKAPLSAQDVVQFMRVLRARGAGGVVN